MFELLETIADLGGVAGVKELSTASAIPTATIHRLLRSLIGPGFLRQEPSREYALGPRLIRLGELASRLLGTQAQAHLRRASAALGESANFALLDGTKVIYVAQSPGQHSMRMFTEVGHRADLHSTGVGKAILASLPPRQAMDLIRRLTLRPHTDRTITSVDRLEAELEKVRADGYALDLEEQDIGVSCVAVALPGGPVPGAVSVSGPSARMTTAVIQSAVVLLKDAAHALGAEIGSPDKPVIGRGDSAAD